MGCFDSPASAACVHLCHLTVDVLQAVCMNSVQGDIERLLHLFSQLRAVPLGLKTQAVMQMGLCAFPVCIFSLAMFALVGVTCQDVCLDATASKMLSMNIFG